MYDGPHPQPARKLKVVGRHCSLEAVDTSTPGADARIGAAMKRGVERLKAQLLVVPEVFVPAIGPLLDAVDAGNLAEIKCLYEKDFNVDSWEWPADWEDNDDRRSPFDNEEFYVAFTLLPECLRRAARQEHWHVVDWIMLDANADACNFSCIFKARNGPSEWFMEEAVADELWNRIMDRGGTVMDALKVCGKGWWPRSLYEDDDSPRREAYEGRTFCDLGQEVDDGKFIGFTTPFGTLHDVCGSFVWSKEWADNNPSVVMFKCCTPDFVSRMFAARGYSNPHLVDVLIDSALKTRLGTNATRWLGIAERLVDMGFSFEYHVLFKLSKNPLHRRLLLKMMRIYGGIAYVGRRLGSGIPAIAKTHRNLILVWVALKMRVLAARARERAWNLSSAHVSRLMANFTANARGLMAAPSAEC